MRDAGIVDWGAILGQFLWILFRGEESLFVDGEAGLRVLLGPLGTEKRDAYGFSYNVGVSVVGVADGAEVDIAGGLADLKGFGDELVGIEGGVDGPVLVLVAGKEAEDAGAPGFDRNAAKAENAFGDLIAEGVGPVGEVARGEPFGLFAGRSGSGVHDRGFEYIFVDGVAAE